MQRWIVMGMVAMVLLIGGGGFGYFQYKQSRPHPMWVPLPLNPQLSAGKREEIAKELKGKLGTTEILAAVSKDLALTKRWRLASDDEAVSELGRRLFVIVGEADSPTGKVPSINVGVHGTAKETGVSEEIALRLMKDVRKILGIKAPPPKEF